MSQPQTGTVFAFDYGSRRTGVAVAVLPGKPEPLTTLDPTHDLRLQLKHLIKKYNPSAIVVGRPRNLEGGLTAQTAATEQFVQKLKTWTDIPIAWQDETLTTQEAEKRLPKGLSLKQKKELRDRYAAVVILEDYLSQ